MRIFEEVLFFQATYNIKTEERKKQSMDLTDVSLMLGGWRKVPASNGHTLSELVVCFYVVRSLEKEDR